MNKNLICGVLHLNSKISYGLAKNGTIKRFTAHYPFEYNEVKYKIFYVKTKKEYQTVDLYAIIKFTGEFRQKIPIGEICEYIGDIGIYKNEQLYLKYLCILMWDNDKKFLQQVKSKEDNLNDPFETTRKDMTHIDNIYSIDPIGCVDIDDALHIQSIQKGTYEIGIHIADPTSYITENSQLDIELQKRCESVYLADGNVVNMLPNNLVELCSLKEGIIRRSYSVIIKVIKNKNGLLEIIDVEICRGLICVKQNLSYEYAEKLIKNKLGNFLTTDNNNLSNGRNKLIASLELLHDFAREYNKNDNTDDLYDTHKMVETYMIMANVLVAEYLIKRNKNKNNVLLRSHEGIKTDKISKQSLDGINPKLVKYSTNLLMNRAEYCISNDDNHHRLKHMGLNKQYYTHFTSPIRRYADMIVHRLLTTKDYETNPELVTTINETKKRYANIERQSIVIKNIFNIAIDYDVLELDGNIVQIDHENTVLKIRILCEYNGIELDLEKRLVNKELEHLVEYRYEDNNDNELIIKSKYNNNQIKIKLFQKIKIKLIILIKQKRKLIMQLLEPDMSILFASSGFLVQSSENIKNYNNSYNSDNIYLSDEDSDF